MNQITAFLKLFKFPFFISYKNIIFVIDVVSLLLFSFTPNFIRKGVQKKMRFSTEVFFSGEEEEQ